MSNSLQPHEPQHTRLPCPQSPGVYSTSCPLCRWHHPTFSSSVAPFSSWTWSLPALGSFPMSQIFTLSVQSIGASGSTEGASLLWPESFLTQFQSTSLSLDAIFTLGCVSCFVMFGFSYLWNGDETREHRQSTLYSAWHRAVHHKGWQLFLWIQILVPGELTSQW